MRVYDDSTAMLSAIMCESQSAEHLRALGFALSKAILLRVMSVQVATVTAVACVYATLQAQVLSFSTLFTKIVIEFRIFSTMFISAL